MATSPQMYDNGLDHLKKAALTVRVRSYLNGNGEIDPADLENPELSLDLQSLIDDPNFEVGDGLFPELLHEKLMQAPNGNGKVMNHEPVFARMNGGQQINGHFHQQQHQNGGGHPRNPLAYMPQPVHGGSSFNHPNGNGNNNQQGNNNNNDGILVKQEPGDLHRLDFNGNAVGSSTDLGSAGSAGSSGSSYGSYSNPLSNVTSPSSSSNGSQGYSPNAYIHHGMTPTTIGGGEDGASLLVAGTKGLNFNGKGLHGHGGHHAHGHHHHHSSSSSKKLKNVDKASDEYKRRRERNNIAVRKSREKAKIRSRETEERVKILAKENERLQKKIELLSEELTFLRSFFSNVGGLPEQIHREFNKHLETFQHHHVQNGIQSNTDFRSRF